MGRYVGVVDPIFHAVDCSLKKGCADAKDVVAQETDRAIAIFDRALAEPFVGDLPNVTLRRAEHSGPLRDQRIGRKRYVAGALHADEFGHVFKVLAEDILTVLREDRDGAWAKPKKLLSSRRIVGYVNCDEVNALFRKKLFRSQATTSAGLRKEDEIVGAIFHCRIPWNKQLNLKRNLSAAQLGFKRENS